MSNERLKKKKVRKLFLIEMLNLMTTTRRVKVKYVAVVYNAGRKRATAYIRLRIKDRK